MKFGCLNFERGDPEPVRLLAGWRNQGAKGSKIVFLCCPKVEESVEQAAVLPVSVLVPVSSVITPSSAVVISWCFWTRWF